MDYLAQILVNGLHNGMVYAVLAWSYVLTASVTHRPNLSHGVVFAFGGQVLVLAAVQGYTILWMTMSAAIAFGIAVSVLLSALLLVLLAKAVFPPLIRRAPNAVIVATLGLAIAISEAVRIGTDTRELWLPPLTDQNVAFSFLPGQPIMTLYQLQSGLLLVAVLAICEYVLRRTSAGRVLRAVSDDPSIAAMLGVNAGTATSLAVFAGGALAALTGMAAVLHYGNMSFGSGLLFSLKVLFLASAGGFKQPLAAAIAAFSYALGESLWDGYMPLAWRDAMFFSILTVVLIFRSQTGGKTCLTCLPLTRNCLICLPAEHEKSDAGGCLGSTAQTVGNYRQNQRVHWQSRVMAYSCGRACECRERDHPQNVQHVVKLMA